MALYEPLRDSFREFNRLILDQQQWKGQQAAAEADNAYKHSMLMSNLQQREFENKMAVESMDLRRRGLDYEADRIDLTRQNQKFDHELRQKKFGIDKRTIEMQEENSKLTREKAALEVRELKQPYEPRDVTFSGLIPEHMRGNEEAMTVFNGMVSTFMDGAVMDSSLGAVHVNEDGTVTPVQMSDKQLQELAPAFQGWLARYNDPVENANANIESLKTSMTGLKKKVNDPLTQPKDKAMAKREINKIKGQIQAQEDILKPENVFQLTGKRAQDAYNSAMWLRGIGMDDVADAQEELALALLDDASRLAGKKLDAEGETGKSAPGLMTENQMMDVTDYYKSEGMMGGIVGSDPVKPKMKQMGILIKKIHHGDPRYGGSPETRALAQAEVAQAVDEYETDYWSAVDKALSRSKSEQKKFIISILGEYNPKATMKQQIQNAYYLQFKDAVRSMLPDEVPDGKGGMMPNPEKNTFKVFRPNGTTRKMLLGESMKGSN